MGKTPGSCDNTTNESNRTAAKEMVGSRMYGQVQVTVKSSDTAGNIELLLPRKDGQVQLLTTKWGDLDTMWAPCPSSLVSSAVPDAPGPPPPAKSTGGLYISDLVLLTSAGRGVQHDSIKWPREFRGDDHGPYQTVEVWPTQIVVTGVAPDSGDTETGSVDLLDPRMAKPNQEIRTDHNMLTLTLTENGCHNLGVTFDSLRHLARAVEIIKTEKANPGALAAAWRIVAGAAEQGDARLNEDEHRRLLREVLPGCEL